MGCDPLGLCQYETAKLVRIRSARLGSLKWALNALIFLFIGIMLFWNKEYQEHDLVVSSVTTKVKGVALTQVPEVGEMLWDMVDHSGTFQGKNSFFVITNVIVTKKQKQGKCPEGVPNGRLCQSDADCNKGEWDQSSHGVQTGACVKSDVTKKTCEVFTWCPVENKRKPPRPALLMAAENFTVLIKNNIRFPAFSYIKRNILPDMKESYLKSCTFNRRSDPLCPIFRLGDIVQEAKENFTEMAVEGGVMGIQINWDCDLDRLFHKCRPSYSFRRLDEKETNRTLYPGLNFRFAKYYTENGVETRTLYKAYGIRFDVMVFGKAGRFSIIQLIIYIGSTLSYYALTTLFIDWLIGTSCYAKEAQRNYSERKFETLDDHKRVRRKPSLFWDRHSDHHLRSKEPGSTLQEPPRSEQPAWCQCARCRPSDAPQEQLCCRQSRGRCISTSPAFERLALGRPLLESVLLYRDPLLDLSTEAAPRLLRHCAYDVYIDWRFGAEREGACPVVPSCCVWRIREEYPSPDGRYRGLRPASKVALIPGAHSGC
uniref:P2X purinoceptor n=1 Tax=Scleropages formosus TaxID=113540 RepID=A0A8C9U024_SCLFO